MVQYGIYNQEYVRPAVKRKGFNFNRQAIGSFEKKVSKQAIKTFLFNEAFSNY